MTERDVNIICGIIVGSYLNHSEKERLCALVRAVPAPAPLPAPTAEPDESKYWSAALDVVADELMRLTSEEFAGRRDKLISVLRNAAYRLSAPAPPERVSEGKAQRYRINRLDDMLERVPAGEEDDDDFVRVRDLPAARPAVEPREEPT
jgi:hypothetical protein